MEKRNAAFTLIELLVVIAILAILTSILMPVFVQAKQSAKHTVCLSRTRQLGMANLMYMESWDEVFAGYVQDTFHYAGDSTPIWTEMVQPFVKNRDIFVCPLAKTTKFGGDWGTRGEISIGYNGNFGNWIMMGYPVRVHLSIMDKPHLNVMYADSSPGSTSAGYRGYVTNVWNVRLGACGGPVVINGLGSTISDRHKLGTVLTFADGHSKWYRVPQLLPNGYPAADDWCQCVADVNPIKAKWLVNWTCKTD